MKILKRILAVTVFIVMAFVISYLAYAGVQINA